MRSRRGSLWSTGLDEMVMQFQPGDLVKPVVVTDRGFVGVVREVDPRINKVWVAWGGGSMKQHDPDEIMLELNQSAAVKARMGSDRGSDMTRRAALSKDFVAGVVPGEPDGTGPHGDGGRNRKTPCPFADEDVTAGDVPGECDGTGPHGDGMEFGDGEGPRVATRRGASFFVAGDPETDPQYMGNPKLHGIESPRGGGFSIMQDLAEDLHKESVKKAASEMTDAQAKSVNILERKGFRQVSDFVVAGEYTVVMQRRRGPTTYSGEVEEDGSVNGMGVDEFLTSMSDAFGLRGSRRGRNAAYWCAPERMYRMTRSEQENGTPLCPKCRVEMAKEPFTKVEKMWVCPKCRFKVPTGKLTTTRVTVDIDKETGDVDVDVTNARRGRMAVAVPADPAVMAQLPRMDLNQIAQVIYDDHRAQGRTVNYAAKPYLEAMSTMRDIKENYMADSGTSIVAYLLGNLTSWGGETARAVKKELNRRLKAAY